MRYTIFLFLALPLFSCDNGSFDKDKRQIAAKDAIREQLPPASHHFEITGFREDTLTAWNDGLLKNPIRYTLNFLYKDSSGRIQQKTGSVIFTPDGKSIIRSQIDATSNDSLK